MSQSSTMSLKSLHKIPSLSFTAAEPVYYVWSYSRRGLGRLRSGFIYHTKSFMLTQNFSVTCILCGYLSIL